MLPAALPPNKANNVTESTAKRFVKWVPTFSLTIKSIMKKFTFGGGIIEERYTSAFGTLTFTSGSNHQKYKPRQYYLFEDSNMSWSVKDHFSFTKIKMIKLSIMQLTEKV